MLRVEELARRPEQVANHPEEEREVVRVLHDHVLQKGEGQRRISGSAAVAHLGEEGGDHEVRRHQQGGHHERDPHGGVESVPRAVLTAPKQDTAGNVIIKVSCVNRIVLTAQTRTRARSERWT